MFLWLLHLYSSLRVLCFCFIRLDVKCCFTNNDLVLGFSISIFYIYVWFTRPTIMFIVGSRCAVVRKTNVKTFIGLIGPTCYSHHNLNVAQRWKIHYQKESELSVSPHFKKQDQGIQMQSIWSLLISFLHTKSISQSINQSINQSKVHPKLVGDFAAILLHIHKNIHLQRSLPIRQLHYINFRGSVN